MPPKSALNSKRNKNKKSASETCISPRADASNASALDPEAEDRFELELCWCIQHMEASLAGGKLQEKQVQELNKQLHSLKSNTAPLVKKRQIMRNTLGDYREKMVEDERKFSKTVSAIKFTGSTSLKKKSIFIKKATGYSTQKSNRQTDDHRTQNTLQSTEQAVCNCNKTESPFKFNF